MGHRGVANTPLARFYLALSRVVNTVFNLTFRSIYPLHFFHFTFFSSQVCCLYLFDRVKEQKYVVSQNKQTTAY